VKGLLLASEVLSAGAAMITGHTLPVDGGLA
jgi:hypothetical protein